MNGKMKEYLIYNFIRERIGAMHIKYIMEALQAARLIKPIDIDKQGVRTFIAPGVERLE
jgi:hypothetical protein